MSTNPIKAAIPLWYAQMIWAKELIRLGLGLSKAEDILLRENRGCNLVPGTAWYIRTHGTGVDILKNTDVGGIDFDFDKPDPDPWRMQIFVERQVKDGNLPYENYRELLDDEELMKKAITEALSQNAQQTLAYRAFEQGVRHLCLVQ
ncbi:DUF6896 domain-containing protein [Pseudidiomarina aestuarii]|uniref:DUF6896 domain-containing protein n=1 Tax=Pseudidiomarina aestuarii TaxID=624146 RepID=UPI003A985DDF